MQFEPHCLTQGDILINGCRSVLSSPPGHGSASLRKADSYLGINLRGNECDVAIARRSRPTMRHFEGSRVAVNAQQMRTLCTGLRPADPGRDGRCTYGLARANPRCGALCRTNTHRVEQDGRPLRR